MSRCLVSRLPVAVAAELRAAQAADLARCYTDDASVKELPLAAARELGCDLASYVPGHPLSGRERSGPAAARADLFIGRPWVICPQPDNDQETIFQVTWLAEACGAQPVAATVADHDRWVALVSHAPQAVSAAMAARLEQAPDSALALAYQGSWTTRIAASGAARRRSCRPTPVRPPRCSGTWPLTWPRPPRRAGEPGSGDEQAAKQLSDLLERGIAGVGRIPGKHGGPKRDFVPVQVVIPDRPGELARLFDAAGEAGVNIEDIAIEHSPGLPVGVAELWVRPDAVSALSGMLAAGGWPVRR